MLALISELLNVQSLREKIGARATERQSRYAGVS
jgi:hypothetical protein